MKFQKFQPKNSLLLCAITFLKYMKKKRKKIAGCLVFSKYFCFCIMLKNFKQYKILFFYDINNLLDDVVWALLSWGPKPKSVSPSPRAGFELELLKIVITM